MGPGLPGARGTGGRGGQFPCRPRTRLRAPPGRRAAACAALGFYWRVTGRLTIAAEASARALEAAPDTPHPARAVVLANQSALLFWLGNIADAHAYAVAAVESAGLTGDTRARAHALVRLGSSLAATCARDAQSVMREAVDLARRSYDPVVLGDALVNLTMSLMWQEDYAAMREAAEESASLAYIFGFDYIEALTLWCQAHEARARHDPARAKASAERVLELTGGDAPGQGGCDVRTFCHNGAVQVLALTAVDEGDPERAAALVAGELARCESEPVPWGVGVLLHARGCAELAAETTPPRAPRAPSCTSASAAAARPWPGGAWRS